MKHRLGVCSWSLRTESLDELVEATRAVGVRHLQLALDPLAAGAWETDEVRHACDESGLEVVSGMMGMRGEDYSTLETIRETGGVRPTKHWKANRAAAERCARAAQELELGLVSFHAGFLPHDPTDPERETLVDRLQELADVFGDHGLRVAFETGQESAETLLAVLSEIGRANVGVNFDPANMILYGMGEPVRALRTLGEHVLQVHVKDAIATDTPGTWGSEVVVGTGEVDWKAFFEALDDLGAPRDLLIEREAGESRVEDMRAARRLLEELDVVEVDA